MIKEKNVYMKIKFSKKGQKRFIILGIAVVLAIGIVLNFNAIIEIGLQLTMGREFPQLQGEPAVGKWYAIDIDDAVSSDGSRWQGYLKKGSENKVMVIFFGGGLSVDEYTVARTLEEEEGFYNARITTGSNVAARYLAKNGIGSSSKDSPFKDGSVIAIPYNNGDFHSGQGEFEYTALDGSRQILYHHGYTNYRLMMEEALKYIGNDPEQVLITGASAGGFGASILADDVTAFFPKTGDFTVYIDSSLLLYDKWNYVMTDVWESPAELSDPVQSSNITLDSLINFKKKHENANILFGSSVRDYNLSMMQTYFDHGALEMHPGQEAGDRYQEILANMIKDMQREIPDSGIYVWDNVSQEEGHLSVYTAQGTHIFFEKREEGPSLAEWVNDSVNGDVKSYGLGLVDRNY